jgi:hypothetical protein
MGHQFLYPFFIERTACEDSHFFTFFDVVIV